MTKRIAITLVPLLAVGAVALLPTAAQAAPHYFGGGLGQVALIPSGEPVPVVSWGTLSMTNLSTGGKVSCHNVIGGVVENPQPGGPEGPAGLGETESFDPYGCESEACTAAATDGGPATYISVFAEGSAVAFPATGTGTMTAPGMGSEEPLVASGANLRWQSVLIGEGTAKVRQETKNVKVNVICHVQTGTNAHGEPEFELQIPEVSQGNDEPVDVTHCCTALAPPELSFDAKSGALENEKGQKGKIEGSLKILGYNNEELINTNGCNTCGVFASETGEYPVSVIGASGATTLLEDGEDSVTCGTVSFAGELSNTSPTVGIVPSYSGCQADIAGVKHGAVVEMKGCSYQLSGLESNQAEEVSGRIAIGPVGCGPVVVEIPEATCKIELPSQGPYGGVSYGFSGEADFEAAVSVPDKIVSNCPGLADAAEAAGKILAGVTGAIVDLLGDFTVPPGPIKFLKAGEEQKIKITNPNKNVPISYGRDNFTEGPAKNELKGWEIKRGNCKKRYRAGESCEVTIKAPTPIKPPEKLDYEIFGGGLKRGLVQLET